MTFYAVVAGHQPGIYSTWSETLKNTKGFSGAIFKKFDSYPEAEEFIKNSSYFNPAELITRDNLPDDLTVAYTDGSFRNRLMGYGVILMNLHQEQTIYGRVPVYLENGVSKISNNVAELYAILIALHHSSGKIIIYSDSNYAISSITSYSKNYLESDRTKIPNYDLIQTIIQLCENRSVKFQHIMAHTGIEMNELVDRLADRGRNFKLINLN